MIVCSIEDAPVHLRSAVGVFHLVLVGLTVSCVMMSRGCSAGVCSDIYGPIPLH